MFSYRQSNIDYMLGAKLANHRFDWLYAAVGNEQTNQEHDASAMFSDYLRCETSFMFKRLLSAQRANICAKKN